MTEQELVGMLIALITLYVLIINGLIGFSIFNECDYPYVLPSDIYEESNMNWFGAIICYILTLIIFAPWVITRFITWLFTVGRK